MFNESLLLFSVVLSYYLKINRLILAIFNQFYHYRRLEKVVILHHLGHENAFFSSIFLMFSNKYYINEYSKMYVFFDLNVFLMYKQIFCY